mmetsp:Transcript_45378/g.125032  ORF Transcript_45378/g.125032 Transcript_45378/m.125032 type:complete len:297 (-) Transcript_45378:851-1741(-)
MEWTRLANTKLRHGSSPSAATRTRRSAPSAYEPGWCGHQFPISPRDVFAVIAPHFVTLLTVVRQHNSAQSARVLATRQRATSNTSASTRHPGPLYHSLYYASCPGGPQAPASLSSTAVPAPHHPSCFPSSVQNLFSIGRRSLVSSGQLLINERRRGSHASDASHALYAGIGMPFPKFFIKFSGVSSTMIVLWRAQPRAWKSRRRQILRRGFVLRTGTESPAWWSSNTVGLTFATRSASQMNANLSRYGASCLSARAVLAQSPPARVQSATPSGVRCGWLAKKRIMQFISKRSVADR